MDPIYDSLGIERESPFGYKYIFELEDAIDAMPESLVDFPAFERYAQCKCISAWLAS